MHGMASGKAKRPPRAAPTVRDRERKQFNVHLSEQEREQLRELAAKGACSEADVIRRAIAREYRREQRA